MVMDNFICIPDVLLILDTALPHSLHCRCYLGSTFLSKARFTCGDISMALSFLCATPYELFWAKLLFSLYLILLKH
jgi:hypothetical protein